ncbi:MAG: hypothetical protein RIQ54_303 [Candidatus Parcubacteria bacterium]
MCNPLHNGVIPWDSAGAASERINVFAVPFIADKPICAVGFAPVDVAYPASFTNCETEVVANAVVIAVAPVPVITPDMAMV